MCDDDTDPLLPTQTDTMIPMCLPCYAGLHKKNAYIMKFHSQLKNFTVPLRVFVSLNTLLKHIYNSQLCQAGCGWVYVCVVGVCVCGGGGEREPEFTTNSRSC